MMAVLLGDIGWRNLYHLGDEAMTESAMIQLRRRGISSVLVAGQPDVATEMYGVDAVPRVGFWARNSPAKHRATLARLDESLRDGSLVDSALFDAVRQCDIAIIAGGGNLNSLHSSHVYERLAFKRVAERLGKPLVVTSQTVGPRLRGSERAAVAEIADYAVLFGCRDAFSASLVRNLTEDRTRIVRTADDAMSLAPTAVDEEAADRLLGQQPDAFAVAAFVAPNDTDGDPARHLRALRQVCQDVAERTGLRVLLTPHVGTFARDEEWGDQLAAAVIEAECAERGGVEALPLMRASTLVAVTRRAGLSFATRYHPAVFASAASVPHVGLIRGRYSSVRIRGALGNYGLRHLGVPFLDPPDMVSAISYAWHSRDLLIEQLGTAHDRLSAHQQGWWDAVSDVAGSVEPRDLPSFPRTRQLAPAELWSTRSEAALPDFNARHRD